MQVDVAESKVAKAFWTVRVSEEFTSARTNPLPKHLRWFVLVLENLARAKPYCWPQNETLTEETGLNLRQVKYLLAELEAIGWLLRLKVKGNPRRIGMVLLRRMHPDSPIWPADRPIEEAIEAIERRKRPRKLSKAGAFPEGAVECTSKVQWSAPSRMAEGAVECTSTLKKDGLGSEDGVKEDTPLPPEGAPEGGARVSRTGESIPFPKEQDAILWKARRCGFDSGQVARVVKEWPAIVAALPDRSALEYFLGAVESARDTDGPVNCLSRWCLRTAINNRKRGVGPVCRWGEIEMIRAKLKPNLVPV